MIRSSDLQPGTRVQHRDGRVVLLDRRKIEGEGSAGLPWLRDSSGGLADFVIDDLDSDWHVLASDPSFVQQSETDSGGE